jgi:integrase
VYTGLRPGELQALTWADVDLEARTLTVSKSFERESRVKAPKTFQGRRVVPLHESLLPLLEKCSRPHGSGGNGREPGGRESGAPGLGSGHSSWVFLRPLPRLRVASLLRQDSASMSMTWQC